MADRSLPLPTHGATLFRAFREAHGVNYSRAADALGVSRATIYSWEDGTKVPEAAARERIRVWTDGAIPPESWATDDERAALARVRPLLSPLSACTLAADSPAAGKVA